MKDPTRSGASDQPAIEGSQAGSDTVLYLGGDKSLTFEVDTDSLPFESAREVARIVLETPDHLAHPERILNAARNPRSPIHHHFEWDDTVAAEKFRVNQARVLLTRVKVFQDTGETQIKIRAFVSIGSDRVSGGGYRPLGSVMSSREKTAELEKTALRELAGFQKRYRNLNLAVLEPVLAEIGKLDQPEE